MANQEALPFSNDALHRAIKSTLRLRPGSNDRFGVGPRGFFFALLLLLCGLRRFALGIETSRRLGKEAQHAFLKYLVSHSDHVISTQDVERPAGRQQSRELVRGA